VFAAVGKDRDENAVVADGWCSSQIRRGVFV